MRLTMDRLGYDVMSLARCMTATDPRFAAGFLGRKRRQLSRGKWTHIRSDLGDGYVYISPNGDAGRYSRELSAGVDENDLDVVDGVTEIDHIKEIIHAKKLITQLAKLLEQLTSGIQVRISGTSEILELTDPDPRKLTTLRTTLAATTRCIESGYNDGMVRQAAESLTRAFLLQLEDAKDNPLRVMPVLQNILNEEANKIAYLRNVCAADGRLSAWFLIYRDLCTAVHSHFREIRDDRIAGRQFIRYAGFGAAGVINDPLALILMILKKMAREGMTNLVAETASRYLCRGEDYIAQALDCQSLEEYNANLYTASLFVFAAKKIYSGILSARDQTDLNVDYYRRAEKVAEEKTVRVQYALCHAVLNRAGERFRYHRSQVEKAKQRGGKKAASQKVFELIEMHYFYPRIYENALTGENVD